MSEVELDLALLENTSRQGFLSRRVFKSAHAQARGILKQRRVYERLYFDAVEKRRVGKQAWESRRAAYVARAGLNEAELEREVRSRYGSAGPDEEEEEEEELGVAPLARQLSVQLTIEGEREEEQEEKEEEERGSKTEGEGKDDAGGRVFYGDDDDSDDSEEEEEEFYDDEGFLLGEKMSWREDNDLEDFPAVPEGAAWWQKEAAYVCERLVAALDRELETPTRICSVNEWLGYAQEGKGLSPPRKCKQVSSKLAA